MTLSNANQHSPAGSGSLKLSELCSHLNRTEKEVWSSIRHGFLPKPIKTNRGYRWVRDDLRRAEIGLPPLGLFARLQLLGGQS